MNISRTLTHNWKAKVVCLLLATGLWYIIKQNVKETPAPRPWPNPAAATESES